MSATETDVDGTAAAESALRRGEAGDRRRSRQATLFIGLVYPIFRAHPFRGLGRLRSFLPVPDHGVSVASFPGGFKLRLDLAESLQRDLLFGLYDQLELSVLRRALARGGDFVDVGAHVRFYAVAAAQLLSRAGGSVLAIEPNPSARAQLRTNLKLNGLDVDLVPRAASDGGSAYRPTSPGHVRPLVVDPREAAVHAGGEHPDRDDQVDTEVAARALRPVFVKVDVEGHELAALAGMNLTIAEHRPVILCEADERTAPEIADSLEPQGFRSFHNVAGRELRPGVAGVRADSNVFFVPEERLDVIPPRLRRTHRRRASAA